MESTASPDAAVELAEAWDLWHADTSLPGESSTDRCSADLSSCTGARCCQGVGLSTMRAQNAADLNSNLGLSESYVHRGHRDPLCVPCRHTSTPFVALGSPDMVLHTWALAELLFDGAQRPKILGHCPPTDAELAAGRGSATPREAPDEGIFAPRGPRRIFLHAPAALPSFMHLRHRSERSKPSRNSLSTILNPLQGLQQAPSPSSSAFRVEVAPPGVRRAGRARVRRGVDHGGAAAPARPGPPGRAHVRRTRQEGTP